MKFGSLLLVNLLWIIRGEILSFYIVESCVLSTENNAQSLTLDQPELYH